MPLIHSGSKKAFKHNVEVEMKENPENKSQNLAIAYNIQRKNKRKKMADGGDVPPPSSGMPSNPDQSTVPHPDAMEQIKKAFGPVKKAYGGRIDEIMSGDDHEPSKSSFDREERPDAMGSSMEDEMHPDVNEHYDSIADAILRKKKEAANFADGGMVDLDENAMEQPNEYYERNEDAVLKENYDSDMDSLSEPMDSNEKGDSLDDEDDHDMVSKIRRGMKMRKP